MTPKAKIFRFCGHSFDTKKGVASFHYQIDFSNREPLEFTETITLPGAPKNIDLFTLDKFLEPLDLILGISYYKLYCPKKVETFCSLTKEQADFWDTVYKKGLGEFAFRNKLDPKDFANFKASKKESAPLKINKLEVQIPNGPISVSVKNRALLGIGGGKDSIVAAELLKGNLDTSSFLIETQKEDPISNQVSEKIGNPIVKIKRNLDPKIFEKYEGAYNGHIPISAIFSFLGLLSAAVYGYKYIIVGNEHSSNFGNIKYKGETINHQWSKSMEYESLLQEYTRKFITTDITYFSLLRQFYEIRIAQMFSEYKKYFYTFSSCNRNFKVHKERPKTLWCGECPKCAFVFLMLSPFMDKKELINIFQKNLLADKKLVPLYNDLLGFGKLKPFDCVGTFEESQAALSLSSKKFANEVVTKTLLKKIKNSEKLIKHVLQTAQSPTLPTPFRFLGIKNICILGYGKEGKITEQYIKKTYPHLKIGILDQSIDKDYLKKQSNYDLAIKTPGIPKNEVTIPYVTATNIFFSQNKNFTIGITGSKGKSTTSSLIYQMLKAAKKDVSLIGNIGNPMLETLLAKVNPKKIFVIELSSYMLEDIEYSPNIGLLLNLFPEHMDYHGGVKNYYKAKKNIFKFMKPDDIAVKQPFTEKIPLKKSEIPLLGSHNLKNIQAAIQVVRLLKTHDSDIKKAIKNFSSLPHRLEPVGTYNGITFYDDAISTTPESTIMAIKSLPKIGTIFLGGEDRGYDFKQLEKELRKHKIPNVVLFPTSGKRILASRKGFNILETKDMKEAVEFAFKNTPKGQVCVLSTASPSYSVWKNFEEKGDLFQKFVRAHAQK